MLLTSFLQGFGASGGLIVAVGAQNAYVLSQGVRGNHHLLIALICILCDGIFISVGIAGVGASIASNPELTRIVTYLGAVFLFVYGATSLRSAFRGSSLCTTDATVTTVQTAIITTLAVTLLNPHFYLDTVLLLGAISSKYQGDNRLLFWIGAVLASTLWFISLSLGSRKLAPLFKRQTAWRILDTTVALVMWAIAISLVATL